MVSAQFAYYSKGLKPDHQSIRIAKLLSDQDVGCKAIPFMGELERKCIWRSDWEPICKNNQRMHIPVFGNEDVNSPEVAKMRDEFKGWSHDWKSKYRKSMVF